MSAEQELIQEYFSILNLITDNAAEIKMREGAYIPAEYDNAKLCLIALLILLDVPYEDKDQDIIIRYQDKIFRENKEKVKSMIGNFESKMPEIPDEKEEKESIAVEKTPVSSREEKEQDEHYERIVSSLEKEGNVKKKELLIYNRHELQIRDASGLTRMITLFVYPLEYNMQNFPTRILVLAKELEKHAFAYSEENAIVWLSFGDISISVSGIWKAGHFTSSVAMEKKKGLTVTRNVVEEHNKEHFPEHFGMYMEERGLKMEIFPEDMMNNSFSGLCGCAALVEHPDGRTTCAVSDRKGTLTIATEGKVLRYISYWMGDGFHVEKHEKI